ncbi:MAG: hypothetical protein AAFR44_01300 [Pseudomonadota bacterium]
MMFRSTLTSYECTLSEARHDGCTLPSALIVGALLFAALVVIC